MVDECNFFDSDSPKNDADTEMREIRNDYDYRCPHCGSAEHLVYLDHINGCIYIIFSCEKCQIGFKTDDLIGQFFVHKRTRLQEKYPRK